MIRQRHRITQYLRAGMLLVLLLAVIASWAQGAGNPSPVTMRGAWSFSESVDIDNIGGMWFAGNDSQGKHAVALAWVPEASAWWPTWRLVLASETGLVPANAKSYQIPGWKTNVAVDLGTAKPVPGHVYEPMISYDPQNGAVSVSLTDLTTGERLRTDGYAIPKMAGPFTVAGGQIGTQESKGVTINALRATTQYVPAATNWQVGVYEGDALITFSSVNPSDKAYLQMKVAGPAPSGQYRVYQSVNGVKKEIAVQPQVNGVVALPTASMPLGKLQLVLEYSEQGQVTYSDSLNLTLGLVDVRFGEVVVDRKAPAMQSSMLVSSKSPLSGINAAVETTITELIWDPSTKKYREEIFRKDVLTLSRNLQIPGDGKAVELPFKVTLPNKPSMWKLSMQPVISPDITVAAYMKPQTFNTYTAPQINAGDPYTIAVLPDTQYLSGYNPVVLDRMTQWLLEKADDKNIGLMLHVGDITDRNSNDQWENAKRSISQLDGLIPYALTLGNHDMSPPGNAGGVAHRGESLFTNYFKANDFAGIQGNSPEGRLDNTYHTFNVAGVDYLVLALEFCPPDEVLEWANKVVAAHPKHKAILLTHAYLASNGIRLPQGKSNSYALGKDTTTTMNDGQGMWDKLVKLHENFFMVISGHINGVGVPWNIDKGVKGNRVYEFLIDYQDHTDGWLVTLEFGTDNKVTVNSYSPYLDKNKTDVNGSGYPNRYQLDLNTGRISYKF